MDDTNTTEARDIMALGSALSDPISAPAPVGLNSIPFVVVPNGYQLHDLEKLYGDPYRAKGTTKLNDADSFIRFVKLMCLSRGPGHLYFWMNPKPGFLAVFNPTDEKCPGWGDHRASYDCPMSVEWTTWKGADGKQFKQEDFAKFIEDNALDCVAPAAADMIEIARSLEAKKKVNFASAIRLANGQQEFTYEEQIQGSASKGRLQVPDTFQIGIPVFEGGERYAVTARLRYRISDQGLLTLWYDLLRPHKIVEHALTELRLAIEAGTETKAFNGVP